MLGFRPRPTTRHLLIVVALAALAAAGVRRAYFASTVYAAGYDEGRFRQVRVGQAAAEVERLLGPPLRKVAWPDPGLVNWSYTDSRPGTTDYWMRDIFLKDGRVINVVAVYWVD